MLDSKEEITKKIMSATTDSECVVRYDMENKPGISNLINIVVSLTDLTIDEVEDMFKGKNYGEFKKYVASVVVDELSKIQEKYNELISSDELDKILENGASVTREIAYNKYNLMKEKMGLYK